MHLRPLLSPKLRRDARAATARRLSAASDHLIDWQTRQLEALRPLWADATTDIPYYAHLVASGNAPKDIRSWSDFQNIPVLTRQVVQDRPADFLRKSGPPDGFTKTAGSTGTPLSMGMNQAERDRMRVVKIAAWQEFGYTATSRLFLIWGHAHLLGTGFRGRLNHIKRRLADDVLGYRRLDAYRLNRRSCEAYAEELLRFNPVGIIGYASALDLFARYSAHLRPRFHALGIRFVLATAEPPPRPDTIALLEDLFGCPVIQEYGGAEIGQIAFKGRATSFEVYSDLNYVECEAAPADSPEAEPILVTTLYPRYVPLVRYRVGDAVFRPERLSHGHVVRFYAVAGRINDVIELDDGDSIHSVSIFHCLHQERTLHNIQMVLHDDGIDIRLISSTGPDPVIEARLRSRLSQVHPFLSNVRFEYVDDVQTNRAGKRRWFVDNRTQLRRGAASRQLSPL